MRSALSRPSDLAGSLVAHPKSLSALSGTIVPGPAPLNRTKI